MKKILLALLLIRAADGYSQTVIIHGEKTTRLLKWSDFTGTPDNSTDLYAYTYWFVTYKWGPFSFNGDTAKLQLEVTLELEKRSWKKQDKITDALLDHEQGHFNIGWLFAIAFQKRVNATVLLRNNYESVIAAIFREELEKYRQLERQYDKETNHFHDKQQQLKWNDYFQKELPGYR